MTVSELLNVLKELENKDMGEYTVVDDDGNDLDEVAVVMSNSTKLVVVR